MPAKMHAVFATNILVARDFIKRNRLDPDKWEAIQTHAALAGRPFVSMIVIDDDGNLGRDKEGHLRTRLLPDGELIVV